MVIFCTLCFRRSLKEDQLYGDRNGDHDWDKIANIDVCLKFLVKHISLLTNDKVKFILQTQNT